MSKYNTLEYNEISSYLHIGVSYALLMIYIKLTYQDDSYMEEYADNVMFQLSNCKEFTDSNDIDCMNIVYNITYTWACFNGFENLIIYAIDKEKTKNRFYNTDIDFIEKLKQQFFNENILNKFNELIYDFLKNNNKDSIYALPYLFEK